MGGLGGVGLGFLGVRYLGTVSFPHEFGGAHAAPLNAATSVLPEMTVSVQWQAVAVAAATAVAVAAVSGLTPADEAARLDPSQAISTSHPARHRLRRVLTGLQLSAGIAAVLLLTAIHEGIALEQLGGIVKFSRADTVMTELTLAYSQQQMAPIANPMKDLVRDPRQVKAIAQACPAFASIESQVGVQGQPIKYGRYLLNQPISAVTAGYFGAEGMRLVEGRLFTAQEVWEGKRVAVLAERATAVLDMDTAAGRVVRIGGLRFEVTGVVSEGAEARSLAGAASQWAYVPVSSVPKSWISGYPHTSAGLRAHLKSESKYRKAEQQLLSALAERLPEKTMEHLELRGNLPDRYRLTGLRRAAAMRASVIGFSALLIAVIGLVNMLLISVSEQTREVGLRRALGATRPSIAGMVVLEALLICLPGCVVGLGIGIAGARAVGAWAHLSTAAPMFWIALSAGGALVSGLLASLMPAGRAAMLDPAVALRHE